MIGRFIIFFLIITAIEIYFLQAVKTFSRDFNLRNRRILLTVAYVIFSLNFLFGIASIIYPPNLWPPALRFASMTLLILVICKLIGILFLLTDDIVRLFRLMMSLFTRKKQTPEKPATGITRLKFFSQLALTFTIIPAVGFLYGIVKGAYKYRVHKVKVPSNKIPAAFNGFKIVQLSDIHTGSFLDGNPLEKAFEIVMQQGADLILFTGDLVNNEASETNGYENVFSKLKAPFGVYSVLGNHDYGDYVQWKSPEEKIANLDNLKSFQKKSGWHLLVNENVTLDKDGEKIALIGIENWGGSMHFPKYGKLEEAMVGTEALPFKILMSHDPSHWEKEVSKKYPQIDLTLSGHTHGMQMGIEIPGFKWSPAKYLYKYWAGLYKQGEQFLYVNRGLGFLGYPGRLGIWPEITVIELERV